VVGVKLAALSIAYIAGHKPPRHPVSDSLSGVPTRGELLAKHELIVCRAAGLGRIAEGKVGRDHIRCVGVFRGIAFRCCVTSAGVATREKRQGDRRG